MYSTWRIVELELDKLQLRIRAGLLQVEVRELLQVVTSSRRDERPEALAVRTALKNFERDAYRERIREALRYGAGR